MSKLVVVDPGKYAVKAVCGEKEFYVRSLVDSADKVSNDKGYIVKIFNTQYVIGDESIPFDYDYDKHKTETKILVNLAIQHLTEAKDEVFLVVGMPIEHWLDRDRRVKYQNFLKSTMPMTLVDNGTEVSMDRRIINVIAVPETIGHIALDSKYKDRTVGILDCGGANFQGAIYSKGLPIRESCFTLNEGGNFYLNSVKRAINIKFGFNYQDYQIQDLIKYGSKSERKSEIDSEIGIITKDHFAKVIREAKARNWNLGDMDIVVTGGGSNYFKTIISDFLPNATFSDNEIWDNVKGFEVIGGAAYGKTNKNSCNF